MSPSASLGLAITAVLFCGATATADVALQRPSERSCLLAWNAPQNQSNRLRLIAAPRVSNLSLRAGVTGTVTWSRGAAQKQTSATACLLTLARPGQIQLVSGVWHSGRVTRWSFGRTIPNTTPLPGANVKLLPDGRVTKIYHH
jgi:hypothetical protein